MRRPAAFDFLVGHARARVILYCATFGLLFLFLDHPDPGGGLLVVLSILLGRYGKRAAVRVSQFRQWQEAWQRMSSDDPAPAAARTQLRQRRGRAAVAVTAWAVFGLWLFANPEQAGTSAYTSLALGFGGLSLWGSIAVLLPLARRARGGRKRKGEPGEFIVRVVPPIPTRSPSLSQISAGLPEFCKRLMSDGSPLPQSAPKASGPTRT